MDATAIVRAVRQYLGHLALAQQQMLELLSIKRTVLQSSQPEQWSQWAEQEQGLVERLQGLLGLRGKILTTARQMGLPAGSIEDLLAATAGPEWPTLQLEVKSLREQGEQVRQESWVQWIVAHRCYRHYTELRDLIAQRGETAPDYQFRGNNPGTGGAMLDTSA